MSESGTITPPHRRRWPVVVVASVVALVVVLELSADALAGWQLRRSLEACGVEEVDVDLGARPHTWALARGRFEDVSVDLVGLRVGPLRVDRVQARMDRVDVPRRRLIGVGAPITADAGEVMAVVTEDDVGNVFRVPLTRVRISEEGIVLAFLGAAVDILVEPGDDGVVLRVLDEALPGVTVPLPDGLAVTTIETQSGILSVAAAVDGFATTGEPPC